MIKAQIPTSPLILGFILGPTLESNLRKVSQLITSDSPINHPIFCIFIVLTAVVVFLSLRSSKKETASLLIEEE